jgi:hypothetical protein
VGADQAEEMSTPLRTFRAYFAGVAYGPVENSTERMAVHDIRALYEHDFEQVPTDRIHLHLQEKIDGKWFWCVGGKEFVS